MSPSHRQQGFLVESWCPGEHQATLTGTSTREQNSEPKFIWETIKSVHGLQRCRGDYVGSKQEGGKIR